MFAEQTNCEFTRDEHVFDLSGGYEDACWLKPPHSLSEYCVNGEILPKHTWSDHSWLPIMEQEVPISIDSTLHGGIKEPGSSKSTQWKRGQAGVIGQAAAWQEKIIDLAMNGEDYKSSIPPKLRLRVAGHICSTNIPCQNNCMWELQGMTKHTSTSSWQR